MQSWVKMPTRWLREQDGVKLLPGMKWQGDEKSSHIACLMIFIVFAQHARRFTHEDRADEINDVDLPYVDGEVNLSYNDLQEITGLSRKKVSEGIQLLVRYRLVFRLDEAYVSGARMRYQMPGVSDAFGWGKLPWRRLYSSRKIVAFQDFKLRKRTELDALKIYLIIIAFRDTNSNSTRISFDKITEYTGIHRSYIKAALSLLILHNLIQVDKHLNDDSDVRNHNVYRVRHVDPYRHAGTDANAFDDR